MRISTRVGSVLLATGLVLGGTAAVIPAEAHNSPKHNRLFDNCTNFNDRYPHGVGRRGARDRTSGDPVTNFKRSTRIYNRAIRHNPDLDRDGDGIACEQH
jgi:hypothetical protein